MEYKDILNKVGIETIRKMKQLLISGGKGDSNFIKNLGYKLNKEENDVLSLIIKMPEYGIWIDKGRGPGKMPPSGVLLNWMTRKGIERKYEFPIRKKISITGIKPTPFLHVFDKSDELVKKSFTSENIEEELNKILEKLKI